VVSVVGLNWYGLIFILLHWSAPYIGRIVIRFHLSSSRQTSKWTLIGLSFSCSQYKLSSIIYHRISLTLQSQMDPICTIKLRAARISFRFFYRDKIFSRRDWLWGPSSGYGGGLFPHRKRGKVLQNALATPGNNLDAVRKGRKYLPLPGFKPRLPQRAVYK
jgi:hypothetical protein